MENEPEPRPWAVLYAKHVLIAWPGLFVTMFVVGVLAAETVPPLSDLFSPEVTAPWIPTWILAGLLAGYYFNRRDRTGLAALVFLPPLAFFIETVWEWRSAPVPFNSWSNVWINLFTPNCGSSECLYVILGTAPLYAGIAYSVGAWLRWRRGRCSQAENGVSGTVTA